MVVSYVNDVQIHKSNLVLNLVTNIHSKFYVTFIEAFFDEKATAIIYILLLENFPSKNVW